jgi:ribosomal protein S18 acetylase RimI-like enzyme
MFPLGDRQNISYFKRFRMEIDLYDPPPRSVLPEGYSCVAWDDSLLEQHAEVMYWCFRDEIDSVVFPSLGDRKGCYHLMSEIRRKRGFLPEATWLLASPNGYCGTIQAVCERSGLGAIQNLGVIAAQRGRGLGAALLLHALHGLYYAGLGRAFLEVTAQNEAAVRLYQRIGFHRRKTIYKAVETTEPHSSPVVQSYGRV